MRANAWESIAVLLVAFLWGGLALGALIFANDLDLGEGLRQILTFVGGMFTVITLSILRKALKMMMRTEEPLPEGVKRPTPPASSPPAPPASSASPS